MAKKQKLTDEQRKQKSDTMKATIKRLKDEKLAAQNGNTSATLPTTEAKKEETITVSLNVLQAMIDENVQKALKSESAKFLAAPNTKLSDSKVSAEDEDDLLEKPVVLYCFKKGYYISGYTYKNKEISLLGESGKPLKFQIFTTVTRPNPINIRETQLVMISKLVVYSKEKLKLIRKHPRYGVDFREELGNVDSYSPEKNQYMVEAHSYVYNELSPHEVAVQLEDKHKAVTMDVERNRATLVEIIAESMYNDALARQAARVDKMEDNIRNTPPPVDVNSLLKHAPVMQ